MNRVALVTGHLGGIGEACASRLAEEDYEVVGMDLATGHDVTDEETVVRCFDEAASIGDLRVVVLAAGTVGLGEIEDLALEDWDRLIRINLTGSFLCAREAARRMRNGPGAIIFISSQAGRKGAARWGAYSASKFGVLGLMESLAQEMAPRHINCNAICPGSVDTPMLAASTDIEAAIPQIPAGRIANPSEIADVVSFLASPGAGYIAGASLVVDGGQLS